LPPEQRDAILQAAAAQAEEDYRNDPELTAFEAFGKDDLYVESTYTETRFHLDALACKWGRPMQVLVMNKKSKYYHALCGRCGQRIRQGRQYVLDQERGSGVAHGKAVPLVYHKVCYEQLKEKK
jgi:hypothetical protein